MRKTLWERRCEIVVMQLERSVPCHLSEDQSVRGLIFLRVHLSKGSHILGFTCPRFRLSDSSFVGLV